MCDSENKFQFFGQIFRKSNKSRIEATDWNYVVDGKSTKGDNKRRKSVHLSRILVILLQWKCVENKAPAALQKIAKNLNDGLKGDVEPKWLKSIFGSLDRFRRLIPESCESTIGEVFQSDKIDIKIIDENANKLSEAECLKELWRMLSKSVNDLTPDTRDYCTWIASAILRLTDLDEDSQVVAGKSAWLFSMKELENVLKSDILSLKRVASTLSDEIKTSKETGIKTATVYDWNLKTELIIDLTKENYHDHTKHLDFELDAVTMSLERVLKETVSIYNKHKEDGATTIEVQDLNEAAHLLYDAERKLNLAVKDLSTCVEKCRLDLIGLLGRR
ncbi:hypothetical protein Pan241w_53350 [Gimesia alba]|uniref:Uncharacterized protein n=2 Tax=Gimesia alba TaxID=2527973 RepID=A0A517RMW4_9PLAN|nr:hypothetical protein Pan241w_53350 [Gimesia alba]